MSEDQQDKSKGRPETCVRLTKEEYLRLEEHKRQTGLSIPQILKHFYFKKPALEVLFPKDERLQVLNQLFRIGNNVNQIAKHMNSGVSEGWYPEFAEITRCLAELRSVIADDGQSRELRKHAKRRKQES